MWDGWLAGYASIQDTVIWFTSTVDINVFRVCTAMLPYIRYIYVYKT